MKSTYVKDACESDDLVIANYPWALHLAKTYYTNSGFDEEIRSAAVLGLVKAVGKLEAGHQITGTTISYVRNYVTGEIMETIRTRRIISIPNTTLRRRRERGDSTAIPVIHDANETTSNSLVAMNAITDPLYCIDTMEDFINELGFSNDELQVLEQRLEGKTVREVAAFLTIEKSMVSLLIKAMKRKWKKWLRGE